jgi:hypothetical protein
MWTVEQFERRGIEIALQLAGLEAVLRTMGLNNSGFLGHLPLFVAFVILALFTYTSGMRAPALIAFVFLPTTVKTFEGRGLARGVRAAGRPRLSADRTNEDFPATSPRFRSVQGASRSFINMDPPEHAGLPNVRVVTSGAQRLPLPAASLDLVHARTAYFFGRGCEPGLVEADRILRPGGGCSSSHPIFLRERSTRAPRTVDMRRDTPD